MLSDGKVKAMLADLDRRKASRVDAAKLTEAVVDACDGEAGLAARIVSEWEQAESETVRARYAALVVTLVTNSSKVNTDDILGGMSDDELEGAMLELVKDEDAGT